MNARRFLAALALSLAVCATAEAKDDWMSKKPADWTAEDVKAVMDKSAWAQTIQVFPTTLAGATKTDKPVTGGTRVPVQAKWFSSRLIKSAIVRNAELQGVKMTDEQKAESTRPDDRFYEILITADKLDVLDSTPFPDLAKTTTLEVDGQSLPLVTILRPQELKGGQSQFIFRKGKSVPATAKSVTLKSTWNGSNIEFKWDLTKMVWSPTCDNGGKPVRDIIGDAKAESPQVRDLDGDFCPVGPAETRRREVMASIIGSGDEALNRAISDVRTKKNGEKTSIVVFYDPTKEVASEGASSPDPMARKEAMAKAVGTWATAHKDDPLEFLLFVDPAKKAPELIVIACTQRLAKLDASGAAKLFKEKLIAATAGADAPNCAEAATENPAKPTGEKTPPKGATKTKKK